MTSPDGVALAGQVALDVEPDASGFYAKLRAQILPAAEVLGRELGTKIGQPVVGRVSESVSEGVRHGSRPATARAARAGEEIGAALARTLKGRVEAALKSLPNAKIDADSSPIERKVANIRRQLGELGDRTIGVDITDDEAIARVQLLRNQLSGLARDVEKVHEAGGDVPLGLDAIRAGAEITNLKRDLADLQKQARTPVEVGIRVGRFEQDLRSRVQRAIAQLPEIELTVDSSDADRDMARITNELAALADARIGVDLDAATALARIRDLQAQLTALGNSTADPRVRVDTAAAAAQLAAIAGEAKAVDAIDPTINVDVDTGGAIASLGALIFSAVAARVALAGLGAAGVSLILVIVPAAAAAAAAIAAIGPAAIAALFGLGALVLAFSGVFGAIQKVSAAQSQAGTSASQLAARQAGIANALDSLRNSEQSLTQAQKAARREQESLTQAREDALRAMQDLNSAVRDGALDQRAALLDLADARQRLDEVMNNPQSTNAERQRAQLALDQAEAQLDDVKLRNSRLVDEHAKVQAAGIEGSTQVVSAQERIEAANEAVVRATQSVAQAQRSLAQAYESAGSAGGAAAKAAADAMAGLSPAGRAFVTFLLALKPIFVELRQAAEQGLLPGVQAGIEAFLPVMPQVIKFTSILATVMGELFLKAGQALASPFWINFFDMLGQYAGPLLDSLGSILGSTAEGFGALFLAFLPFSDQMIAGLADLAAGFAEWAKSLAGSAGFESFLAYVRAEGPKVLELLGALFDLVIRLGEGLAPLASVVLDVAIATAEWLASLSPGELIALVAAVGALVAVIVVAVGGPITAIIVGIIAVAAAVVYAYKHFEIFRTVVDAVFSAIATAAVWLWETVLRPTFTAIGAFIMWTWVNVIQPALLGMKIVFDVLAPIVVSFWQNVIVPAFAGIQASVEFAWAVLQPILAAIGFMIENVLIPVVLFLWHNVIEPAWQGIQLAISVAWAVIQVVFGLIQIGVKIVAGIFSWLYEHVIKPAFDGIRAVINTVWEFVKPIFTAFGNIIEQHVAPAFRRGVDAVSAAWSSIQDAAKKPIKFVIETVLNAGLLAAYNKIASMFGVKPDNVQIPLPAGFATGGYIAGPGSGTSDSILARLSNGEYVIPAAVVSSLGVDFFDQLIGRAGSRPGDTSQGIALPGFADGGFVGGLASLWNGLSDPIGYVRDKVNGLIAQVPGVGMARDILRAVGDKVLGGTLTWIKDKIENVFTGEYAGPVSGDVAAVQDFIRAQAGKPYAWAEAGPAGYDCSGLVSAAWNLTHGRQPHNHTFSTANEAAYFPKPGRGAFTAGWAGPGQRGGGSVGHTAGNLVGLKFESRGGDGVVVGPKATDVASFANVGTYDTGGYLMPGITIAHNATGRPEPVLTGAQWDALIDGRSSEPANYNTYYQVYPAKTNFGLEDMQSLQYRNEALQFTRTGRTS
jgi:hypothetical protein